MDMHELHARHWFAQIPRESISSTWPRQTSNLAAAMSTAASWQESTHILQPVAMALDNKIQDICVDKPRCGLCQFQFEDNDLVVAGTFLPRET